MSAGYKNLRVYILQNEVRLDYFYEHNLQLVVIRLPNGLQLNKDEVITFVFEYEWSDISEEREPAEGEQADVISRRWYGVFGFESYPIEVAWTNVPSGSQLYISHPSAMIIRDLYRSPEDEDLKPKEYPIYSTGEEVVRRFEFQEIKNEPVSIKYNLTTSPTLRFWLLMGGYLAIIALGAMIMLFLLAGLDLWDRVFNIGTIIAGTFSALFAIRSWVFKDENRLAGAYHISGAYRVLSIIVLSLGAALILSSMLIQNYRGFI